MSKPVSSSSRWYVVETNPCCETRAKLSLTGAGFGCYLPQYPEEYWNRRKTVHLTRIKPVMPGYLFVEKPHVPPQEWWSRDAHPTWFKLRRCDGVKRVLPRIDARGEEVPFAVPTKWVEDVMEVQIAMERAYELARSARLRRDALGAGGRDATLALFPMGSEVRVREGEAFESLQGRVERVSGMGRIEILLNLFGRMTAIELGPEQVEAVAA